MHPVEAKIEFLSPTEAYDVLRLEGEPGVPPEPGYIKKIRAFINSQAFVNANPEKYNGAFSVTQLERWAFEKGWITTDVTNLLGTTLPYADPQVAPRYRGGRTSPPDFPANDLFGWMTNQHRQIFETQRTWPAAS